MTQTQEDLVERDFPSILAAINEFRSESIVFMRLYFPFGDMTIEFQQPPVIFGDEFGFTEKNRLARRIEAPLFAFDASRSDIWASFLVDIHWAADLIDRKVLLTLIKMSARVSVS